MLSINSKLISEAIFHFSQKNYRNVISTTLLSVMEMTLWLQSTIDVDMDLVMTHV